MGFIQGLWNKSPQQQQTPQQQGPQGSDNQQVQNPRFVQQNPGSQNQGATNTNGSGGPAGSQQNGPANSNMNPGGNPSNPLDPFMQLMTPPKEVQESYQAEQQRNNSGLFGDGFTPDAISGHLKNTNFAANLDPALVQKALSGDQNSFMEVMNSVAQNAVSTSIQMSKGMVEHGVKTGTDRFGNSLDSRMRNFQLQNQTTDNPALKHPVGKALLKTVTSQIASANPKLSAEEAHAKGVEMFQQFAQMLVAKPDSEQQSQDQAPNWEAFLE